MAKEKTTYKKPKMIHVRLNKNLHQKLRIHVANENLTIQDWVEKLIEDNVKSNRVKRS